MKIEWIHLLLLWLAEQNGGTLANSQMWQATKPSYLNEWLEANGVPEYYGLPFKSGSYETRMFNILSPLGLAERPGITITDKGRELIAQLNADWKLWPRVLPFTDAGADWPNATYINQK